MTKSTFMEEQNRRHCKHSEVRDITNINVRIIGGETTSELKLHMEILIPRIKKYKQRFYKLRRLAIEMNDNTIQTRAVLKYTDILLNGLDYMIMMNSILPYDKLNAEVGKVLGEILFTITMSEAFGIVRWHQFETDSKYKRAYEINKKIGQYDWIKDLRCSGDVVGFYLDLRYASTIMPASCKTPEYCMNRRLFYEILHTNSILSGVRCALL